MALSLSLSSSLRSGLHCQLNIQFYTHDQESTLYKAAHRHWSSLTALYCSGRKVSVPSENEKTRGSQKENRVREGADGNGSASAIALGPHRLLRRAVAGLVAVRVECSSGHRLGSAELCRATDNGGLGAAGLCRSTDDNCGLGAAGFCSATDDNGGLGAEGLCRGTDNGNLGAAGLCSATDDNGGLGANGLCRCTAGLCTAASTSFRVGAPGVGRSTNKSSRRPSGLSRGAGNSSLAANYISLRAPGLGRGTNKSSLAATGLCCGANYISRGAAGLCHRTSYRRRRATDRSCFSAAGCHVASGFLPATGRYATCLCYPSSHATSRRIAYRRRRCASPGDSGSSRLPARSNATGGACPGHAPSSDGSDTTSRCPRHASHRATCHGSRTGSRFSGSKSKRRPDPVSDRSSHPVAHRGPDPVSHAGAYTRAVELGVGEPVAGAGARARSGGRVGGAELAHWRRRGPGGRRARRRLVLRSRAAAFITAIRPYRSSHGSLVLLLVFSWIDARTNHSCCTTH
jgi:hypothetical protein